MKKIVAVTQRVDIVAARNERRDALDQRWADFLSACDLVGFPVPNHPELACDLLEAVSPAGLVLTGGNDLAGYGGDAPERDETERRLIDWARRRKLPILAVCRGMQVVADAFSANLGRLAGHAGTRHRIRIDGGATRDVNSYHTWSVAVPEGFSSWAIAEDGSVEAMRHASEPITGILWHPEREAPYHSEDIALFREVFGATR